MILLVLATASVLADEPSDWSSRGSVSLESDGAEVFRPRRSDAERRALVEAYDRKVFALYGEEEEEDVPDGGDQSNPKVDRAFDVGQEIVFPYSAPVEDRVLVSSGSYPHDKVVMVMGAEVTYYWLFGVAYQDWDVQEGCSGTFISPTHVLTAAHCVYDNVNDQWKNTFMRVCAEGGDGDCSDVIDRSVSQDWVDEASTVARYDYAVLELADSIGAGRWMGLSNLTGTSAIAGKNNINKGYPDNVPSTEDPNWVCDVYDFECYADLYKNSGEGVYNGAYWNTAMDFDVSPGQSGGPVFYYSDNADSYTGQGHWMTSLISSGVIGAPGAVVYGPKIGRVKADIVEWME